MLRKSCCKKNCLLLNKKGQQALEFLSTEGRSVPKVYNVWKLFPAVQYEGTEVCFTIVERFCDIPMFFIRAIDVELYPCDLTAGVILQLHEKFPDCFEREADGPVKLKAQYSYCFKKDLYFFQQELEDEYLFNTTTDFMMPYKPPIHMAKLIHQKWKKSLDDACRFENIHIVDKRNHTACFRIFETLLPLVSLLRYQEVPFATQVICVESEVDQKIFADWPELMGLYFPARHRFQLSSNQQVLNLFNIVNAKLS